MDKKAQLEKINLTLRSLIIESTTHAGSGHPSSCMSAVELMSTLFFDGHLRYDPSNPKSLGNDRVVFSKGHAAPLLYSLFTVAGAIKKSDLMGLRRFTSALEGHPSVRSPLVEVATGSLGQGLSVGAGMALGAKVNVNLGRLLIKRLPKIWVLMGDSEIAEGQIWEAMELASFHKLDNLVGIIDVNRLGQTNETIDGWDIVKIASKVRSFGWNVLTISDGNDVDQVMKTMDSIEDMRKDGKPTMIVAKTIKGKGISFVENKDGWHGKPLSKEQSDMAIKELGPIDSKVKAAIKKPESFTIVENKSKSTNLKVSSKVESKTATREAYGEALVALSQNDSRIVALDAEMANSTFSSKLRSLNPGNFFEMFIAEQNMVSMALGLSKMGLVPMTSSFAAFLTRAFDQLRMAGYSDPNIKIIGSHAGVSIGQDGPSQMGLEDIAMARSIMGSIVLCPSDGVSAFQLTELMAKKRGLFYMRTARPVTPSIYGKNERFIVGGSKVHNPKIKRVKAVVIAMGVTMHEALRAQRELEKKGIGITVIDLYSIKPLDKKTIINTVNKIKRVIVVEDHGEAGGIGDAVSKVIVENNINLKGFVHLSVNKMPRSGSPEELLSFEGIDSKAIIKNVNKLVQV